MDYSKCDTCGKWTPEFKMDRFIDFGSTERLCPECSKKKLGVKRKKGAGK